MTNKKNKNVSDAAAEGANKPTGPKTASGKKEFEKALNIEKFVDLLEVQDTIDVGKACFAREDVPTGKPVLIEVVLLDASLRSEKAKAHQESLAKDTLIDVAGEFKLPKQVSTPDVGILDAFVESSAALQAQVLQMQHHVAPESPISESTLKAAQLLKKANVFESLSLITIQHVLLVARVNAYGFGPGRQALFSRGRFIAHSCQPNCIFVKEQFTGVNGQPTLCGTFRALRDIPKGELVSICYIPEDFAAQRLEQRKHYLLCQKGFVCRCAHCIEDGETPDKLDLWPCPSCRPRDSHGNISQEQLAGCCVVRAAGTPPLWRSMCGKEFSDAQVLTENCNALVQEALLSVYEPPAQNTVAVRNATLARVIQCMGEDHSASQLLLRTGALRAVASVQALDSLSERVARCHEYLVNAGWPLGMMPMHGLYKAIISRAQAEAKAKSPIPAKWLQLVADAAKCAGIVEGPDSDNTKLGTVLASLLGRMSIASKSKDGETAEGYPAQK